MPGRPSFGKSLGSPDQSRGTQGHHQSHSQRRPNRRCWPRQGHVHSQGQAPPQTRALYQDPALVTEQDPGRHGSSAGFEVRVWA